MKGIKNETKGKPKIRARPARRRNSVPSARQPADSVQPAVAAELIVTTSGLHSNPPRRTMEDAAIDEHYNARRDLDSHQENMMRRKFSPIYHLKQFNNWVKSTLISRFCPRGAIVLDFCSGRSGDMQKLIAAGAAHVVSCDFARASLVDASIRYNELLRKSRSKPILSYEFFHANCFEADIPAALPSTTRFDFAQCQFALHYAFDSEAHVRRALENVTARLNPGGYFVGTTTDSRTIMKKMRESPERYFGNSLCRVKWVGRIDTAAAASGARRVEVDPIYDSLGIERESPFGYKYIFELEDAIDAMPESLVDFPAFERLAAEYGLRCIMRSNFHDFFLEHSVGTAAEPGLHRDYRDKFAASWAGILDAEGRVPADTWDIAYLYRVFVFQKMGDPASPTSAHYVAREIRETDIRSLF